MIQNEKTLCFMGMRASQLCEFFKDYFQRTLRCENGFG